MMKVTIPDGWGEVSVGQYQELLTTNKDIDIVSILLDEDPENVKKFDTTSMTRVLNHLSWAKTIPDENHYKAFVEIDGVEYRLIENLNKFSLGEWADMEEYLKDFNKNMHLILAMLYRAGEYDSDICIKNAEIFQERMMIGDVYGSFVFFSHVEKQSTISIQDYLIRQLMIQMKQQKKEEKELRKKGLLKNGTGTATPIV